MADASTDKKSFIAKLNRRVSFQNIELTKLCRTSYAGGFDYLDAGYLFSHSRENNDDFVARKKRAYFLNYTAPVIDSYSFFLFKSNVVRTFDTKSLILNTIIANCDMKATSLNAFMKGLSTELLQAGFCWVVVDVPDVKTNTKMDELLAGKRPYLYTIPTEDILDFEEDDEGLTWIKYKLSESSKYSWDYDGKGFNEYIAIWSRDSYNVYDSKTGDLIHSKSKPLTLGFIPIVKVKFGEGKPLVRDIAIINRALFNWCSLLDEILYRQTFSWLVVPADPSQKLEEKKIGTAWAWTFHPESKHAPQFISPDIGQAELIMKQIASCVIEIYRLACLDWTSSEGVQQKSGVARAYDFMNVNKILAAISSTLEEAEKKVFNFVSRYYGKPADTSDGKVDSRFDIAIEYPKEFSFVALADKLQSLYDAMTTKFSSKFNELCAKQIVEVTLPSMSEADHTEIYEEIEENRDSLIEMFDEGSADANTNDSSLDAEDSASESKGPPKAEAKESKEIKK